MFIPKTDSQISRLLVTREGIFDNYILKNFEKEFENFFDVLVCCITLSNVPRWLPKDKHIVPTIWSYATDYDVRQKIGLDDSERILYLMEKKVTA